MALLRFACEPDFYAFILTWKSLAKSIHQQGVLPEEAHQQCKERDAPEAHQM